MTKGTKGAQWGKVAIGYLNDIKYERRRGVPVRSRSNFNFSFGHENEPLAMAWLRANYPLYIFKSCQTDYDEIVFATNPDVPGHGDSPDFYALNSDETIAMVGEIKCPVDRGKIEDTWCSSREDVIDEYCDQFCGHLIAHPEVDKLMYLVYDGTSDDDDEDDEMDLLDPERGRVFIYTRADFGDRIHEICDRINEADRIVNTALEMGCKVEHTIYN